MSHPASDRKAKIQAAMPRQRRSPLPWIAGLVVLLLLAGGVGFALWQNSQKRGGGANASTPPNANDAKSGIIVNPGKAEGKPVVALFQDYQCPACKSFEDKFGTALEELASSGQIQFEYHTMTFLDDKWGTQASHKAAEAAACADTVGAYAKFHDTIYKHQPDEQLEIEGKSYTEEQLSKEFPAEAGITGEKLKTFQSCVKDSSMKGWVQGTNEASGKENISQTPTLKINGKDFQLDARLKPEEFKKKLLAAAK